MIYFNDNEKYVTRWLRNLYPEAHVDDRSVTEVTLADVADYTRAHFFAGIGGWELALTMAGWPEDAPAWTASLPCQPFSTAGKRLGSQDERHLWPVFRNLVEQCLPPVIFGEQVASKDGRLWLSGVRADLEALGYAVGAADLCAAGIGAPHIRQRLYWVANAPGVRRQQWGSGQAAAVQGQRTKRAGEYEEPEYAGVLPGRLEGLRSTNGLGNSHFSRLEGRPVREECTGELSARPSGVEGFWDQFDLAYLTDSTVRRIEPGSFPLAHGIPNRVGRIRAYGGAIVPQVAAEFVAAYMESIDSSAIVS
jgi:DNA (cytosine-5)-methyltransferase 1